MRALGENTVDRISTPVQFASHNDGERNVERSYRTAKFNASERSELLRWKLATGTDMECHGILDSGTIFPLRQEISIFPRSFGNFIAEREREREISRAT